MIETVRCLPHPDTKEIIIEVGEVAKQSNAAVKVICGETIILVAVVADEEPAEEGDFFPLTVDYREKFYAAGKIPGGFFKREGKPDDRETLTSRLIDRPIRPLFPEGFRNEVQVLVTVLSADNEVPQEVLSIIGASSALCISDIPFNGPIGAVKVGLINDKFVTNPSNNELDNSLLDIVVAGTKTDIIMVESSAKELSEEKMIEALEFAQSAIQNVISAQEELMKKCGKPKMSFQPLIIEQEIIDKAKPIADEKLKVLNDIYEKNARSNKYKEIINEIVAQFLEEFPEQEQKIKMVISDSEREMVRNLILKEKRRPDGRKFDEVRPIECKVTYLPRTHGSALFTRGQTQSLGVVTLGSISDKQRIDNLEGESTKRFMLHYNFPPYSVGEIKPLRGPGRREIGHGALAEKSLVPVIPPEDDFPYTIRIVSEILESNGSSSMATVCSGSLSLMDAGVPIKSAVAGIAMGLVMENNEYAILTDIQGIEDHLGDMDFKVAGTENGITSLQMDLKIGGLSKEILREALEKANVARKFVLSEMAKIIDKSRPDLSPHAPRVIKISVATDKIRDIIGPGGKVIRNIIEKTGTTIDILDNGDVFIYSKDKNSANAALEMINYISAEVEVGKIYNGKVVRVTNFGAFVEILPGKEGLVHISQLADRRVNRVEDICREGDELLVKCVEIDSQGRINLSRKLALQELNESKK